MGNKVATYYYDEEPLLHKLDAAIFAQHNDPSCLIKQVDVIEIDDNGLTGLYDLFDDQGECLNEGNMFAFIPTREQVKQFVIKGNVPDWIDKHSVNCFKCGKLVDERECIPNVEEGGSICPACQNKE